jgi:hypothetical protein
MQAMMIQAQEIMVQESLLVSQNINKVRIFLDGESGKVSVHVCDNLTPPKNLSLPRSKTVSLIGQADLL